MKWLARISTGVLRAAETLSPTCRDVSRLQAEALHQRLPLTRRAGVRLHLLFCAWCRRYREQLRILRGAMERRPNGRDDASHEALSEQARARMKRRLGERKE